MGKASSKKKGPKFDPNLEYVLQRIPPPQCVIPNFDYSPQWVESVNGGVVETENLNKAMKFRGSWLAETVWYFELFFVAVIYGEAINWWKQQNKKESKDHEKREGAVNKRSIPKGNQKGKRVRRSKPQNPAPPVQRAKGGRRKPRR